MPISGGADTAIWLATLPDSLANISIKWVLVAVGILLVLRMSMVRGRPAARQTSDSASEFLESALIAIDFIEHISKDDMMELLRHSRRVLSPGGRLVLRYPNGDSPLQSGLGAEFGHLDTREQVLACIDMVKRAGLDFLVLDHTRPDIEVPVIRVIVPGLRHFYRRFAPGRLYDVPVKLGWLNKPTLESDLNPVHPHT